MARDPRKKRKRANAAARVAAELPPWTPFEEVPISPELYKVSPPETNRVVVNSRYQVNIRALGTGVFGTMAHLSIKRNDRDVIRDWRELQRIKNEVLGPNTVGFEFFPDEANLMDSVNQYHLWCSIDAEAFYRVFPFLIRQGRLVAEEAPVGGRQEPFPADNRPTDLASCAEMERRVAHLIATGEDPGPES